MNKRRTVTILVAAALVVTMAATAVAAGISKISTLGDYFEGSKKTWNIPDEVPIMKNPEDYANEVTTSTTTAQTEEVNGVVNAAGAVENYTPPAPGEAKVAAVSATEHSLFVTVEFNAAGLDIPQELPENARPGDEYGFEWVDTNFTWSTGSNSDVSRNGDIFTYVWSWSNIMELPEDEIVLKPRRIGYIGYDEEKNKVFNVVKDIELEIRLPVSEINIMKSIKSTNSVNIFGTDYSVELSAYEVRFCSDYEPSKVAADLEDEEKMKSMRDYFYSGVVELHMLDGTIFTEDHSSLSATHLVTAKSNFINRDKGVSGISLSFDVPLDVAQIDYITINDARFDFAH